MPKVLIVYASSHGQTRLVAEVMANEMRALGADVTLADANAGPAPSPGGFDTVVVGSRIWFDRPARSIRRYVREHRVALGLRRRAFFTVSMGAAGRRPEDRAHAEVVAARFLQEVGLYCPRVACFAGALRYREYSPLLRFAIRRIAAAGGLATDTCRDYELTDFAAVGRFAAELVDSPDLGAEPTVPSAAPGGTVAARAPGSPAGS